MQKIKNSKRTTEDNVPLTDWVNHADSPLHIEIELADNQRVPKKVKKDMQEPKLKDSHPYNAKYR